MDDHSPGDELIDATPAPGGATYSDVRRKPIPPAEGFLEEDEEREQREEMPQHQ